MIHSKVRVARIAALCALAGLLIFIVSWGAGYLHACCSEHSAYERYVRNVMQHRDSDKTTFYYLPLRGQMTANGGVYWPLGLRTGGAGARGNYFAVYGASLKFVSAENGVDTFEVDQWEAREGPDRIVCRMTLRFSGQETLSVDVKPLVSDRDCFLRS